MDPVSVSSIVTGAASLAIQCAQAAKCLHDLRGKLRDAPLTIISATQEIETVRIAWDRIQKLLSTWGDDCGADIELLQQLGRQVEMGAIVLTGLSNDLHAFEQDPSSSSQRTKIVWNESLLAAHRDRVRGQATAMTLLLSVLQMPSAIERKEHLVRGETILKDSNESVRSIVPTRLSSRLPSYMTESQRQSMQSSKLAWHELSIDNELFSAGVYKRNYRNHTMRFETIVPETPDHCVWAVNVNYLTPTCDIVASTVEGPVLSILNQERPLVDDALKLFLPSVSKLLEVFDAKIISKVLRSNEGRFRDWRLCLLYEACKQGNSETVQLLLAQNVWIDRYEPFGNAARLCRTTPLHVAAHYSRVEKAGLLLEKAGSMDAHHKQDSNGYRALHFACREGPLQMVRLLVQAGAQVNCHSEVTNVQPLHVATRNATASFSILRYLLKQGADPTAQAAEGITPIHAVCMSGRIDMMKELLARKPNLEVRDSKGRTPLHVACRYASLELVVLLLQAGAEVDLTNHDGRSTLYVACTRGILSIVQEILKRQQSQSEEGWSESPLVVAVSGFNFPIVSTLLAKGYDANLSCEITGKTLLQQAISQDCSDIQSLEDRRFTIVRLLDFGANAGTQDLKGNNVLHHWASTAVSSDTQDISTYHIRMEEQRCQSLLDLLVKHGANVQANNFAGETPWHLASRRNNSPLIKALQIAGARPETPLVEKILEPILSLDQLELGNRYSADYPDLEIESFTRWKAGAIPRNHSPQKHPPFRNHSRD